MKTALIVLGGLILLILLAYSYFGGFRKIRITVEKQGGETIVYEELTGPYSKSGAAMDRVYYSLLNDYNIHTTKGFGIYYDNPAVVEKEKLRSEAGCIIEEKDSALVASLNGNFSTGSLPLREYLVTEFPYRGKLSVMVSLMKVYPALQKFTAENGYSPEGAVIEIYDIPNKKIRYRKEISASQ